ncbi:MAG: pentapeptide repeat-containing protein [Bauldia sp.]
MLARYCLGLGVALAVSATIAEAQVGQAKSARRASFWDLTLGRNAGELSAVDYVDFACGTNGGPPATPIKDWREFAKCPAEKDSNLREVQFRYDDEEEYWARAHNLTAQADAAAGTKIYDIAVIASVLFDDAGTAVGLRAVSDPRVPSDERMRAISLRSYLFNRFDPEGWACQSLPYEEGEQPIGDLSFKETCSKQRNGVRLLLQSNFYRKRGQVGIDPRTNIATEGQFRSDIRLEMILADRTAAPAAQAKAADADPRASNRAKAMNCPGCDLHGIDLKRQDLRGANLAGANLEDANLHGANLDGADLRGAKLSGINLNRATLRRAKLAGAVLADAMLYKSVGDGADFSSADLGGAMLGEAQLVRADLSQAKLVGLDLTRGRLTDANLKGADLTGSWLTYAQLTRANLEGASIVQVDLTEATLVSANLTAAEVVQTDMMGANLRAADLTNTKFDGSRLTRANLADSTQTGTTFRDMVP